MITVGFVCTRCGHKFEAQIFEKGEAETKRVRGAPVRCPKCGSTDIKQR